MSGAVTTVLYPGSFDPFHNGHLEAVEVTARLFDVVWVAAGNNPQKGTPLFELEERKAMIKDCTVHLGNVEITSLTTLVVDLAHELKADFIVKGLRNVSDFESEIEQAQMNHSVSGVHTLFLPSTPAYSFIASKYVRDIARLGGDVTHLVPPPVADRLREQYYSSHE